MKFSWQREPNEQTQDVHIPKSPTPSRSKGRIIVLANQKGGVGKTTTAVQTGSVLPGRKLLVDLDPQGNASFATGTYMLGIDQPTMIDLFSNPTMDIRDCIVAPRRWGNLDVIPCDIRLAALEQEAATGERVLPLDLLREKLAEVADEYDYIIIDTPPSLGAWTINALRAAHRVLVPIESSDPYSVLGFNQLVQAIHKQQIANPYLRILGCFRTMLLPDKDGQERTRIGNQLWDAISQKYPELVMKSAVPVSVKIREATLDSEHISLNYESTPAAKASIALALEIVDRWEVTIRTW